MERESRHAVIDHAQLWWGILFTAPVGSLVVIAVVAVAMMWVGRK